MTKKYVFKPYSSAFPKLFLQEKARIVEAIDECLDVQHVGSTAVPGLGGKGIIDIAIGVNRGDIEVVSQKLEGLGYIFRESGSASERWFFRADLPDTDEGIRRYHVHVMFFESGEWKNLLLFRDYLKAHPEEREEYAKLKEKSAHVVNEDGAEYRRHKDPFFKAILIKAEIDVSLVRRLVDTQFPRWKNLPIWPVAVSGWDNRTFHLGKEMLIRMPSAAEYASQVEKEHTWLPKLAPFLPLFIPAPLAMGNPTDEYPWKWSIYRWLEGEAASFTNIDNLCDFARSLAEFLLALQRIDSTGGPLPGPHSFYRGGSLAIYDAETREAIVFLKDKINADTATKIWEAALKTTWKDLPVWVHGDISVGNLLVQKGRLFAVIDFGQLTIGDPSCDLAIAWTFLKGESREVFQRMLPFDAGTWARARGWALWKALITTVRLTDANIVERDAYLQIINERICL